MDPAYSMDVDDLFGDSEHVTLQTINAPPPVKGLVGRVDELGSSGCCQYVTNLIEIWVGTYLNTGRLSHSSDIDQLQEDCLV